MYEYDIPIHVRLSKKSYHIKHRLDFCCNHDYSNPYSYLLYFIDNSTLTTNIRTRPWLIAICFRPFVLRSLRYVLGIKNTT